ncbi:hypothetical protein HPB48_002347 [Haemaphysalis longicornis]|uniref:DDE-1 domain-containing protein n=1 Tax=Haemaphysalis longicornis TaxID=44386 RepID=A0A9J6GQR8_HAELO|nr:hypothetical protein HPB48_002347 [Haemaphysalis longicornis]
MLLEFSPLNTTSVLPSMDQGVIKNLKLHYRSRLLNRVLLCVDSNKSYAVDELSAISILSDAWGERYASAFGMRGFVVGGENEDSDTVPNPTAEMPPATASNIFDDRCASGVDFGAATFEDFTDVDSAVLPCAELDDDEIVRQVLEPEHLNSVSNHDMPPMPDASNTDIAEALTVLLSCYSEEQTLAEMQVDLVARRRACVQTRLHTFFQPFGQ